MAGSAALSSCGLYERDTANTHSKRTMSQGMKDKKVICSLSTIITKIKVVQEMETRTLDEITHQGSSSHCQSRTFDLFSLATSLAISCQFFTVIPTGLPRTPSY